MFYIVFIIILIAFAQMLIGSLWYSKFLFGNIFMKYAKLDAKTFAPEKVKKSFMLAIGLAIIKSIIIYIITYNIFYMLPQYFFTITIAIVVLTMLLGLDEFIWGNKHIKLVLLNITETGVSMLVSFLIALMLIS